MSVNTFLIESGLGWTERTDDSHMSSDGRIEQLLGLGALGSLAEVNRVADEQFSIFAKIREAADLAVSTRLKSRLAYFKYALGDQVSTDDSFGDSMTKRVASLTGSEDDAGFVTVVPTVGDLIMDPEVALTNAVRKMISGSVHGSGEGQSKVAQPIVPEGRSAVPAQVGGVGCCGWSESQILADNPDPGVELPDGDSWFYITYYTNPPFTWVPPPATPCSPDMSWTARIITWDADAGDDGFIQMDLRAGTAPDYSITFTIDAHAGGGVTYMHRLFFLGHDNDYGDELDEWDGPRPAPGDVFVFTVVGDTATVTKNGTQILSTSVAGMSYSPTLFGNVCNAYVLPAGFGAGPYEQRYEATFTSICEGA